MFEEASILLGLDALLLIHFIVVMCDKKHPKKRWLLFGFYVFDLLLDLVYCMRLTYPFTALVVVGIIVIIWKLAISCGLYHGAK